MFEVPSARYSIVTARPFQTFQSMGSRCETRRSDGTREIQFGNPWAILGALSERCEILDEIDLPFPLGGIFGFWGYDLKGFVEPRLSRHAVHDLESTGAWWSLIIDWAQQPSSLPVCARTETAPSNSRATTWSGGANA
jgi:hypothetical protein